MAQMTFVYKVRDKEGKLLEGTLDATTRRLSPAACARWATPQ